MKKQMEKNENKRIKKAAVRGSAAVLAALMLTNTAWAGTWIQENRHWRYRMDDGRMASAGWVWDNGWYCMDENGNMKTGWVMEQGKWYFLDTRAGGPQGRMLTGWQWIDGKCYYLNPQQGGAMMASETTPDGYLVGADGAWSEADGRVHYEAGKGIRLAQPEAAVEAKGSGQNEPEDQSVGFTVNDFMNGNESMMSASQRAELADAIEDFKDTYLTSGMSDFEIEIKIIEWLVENCFYEQGKGWSNATAYSCIVNGRAQCAGYADAFLQMAKACGLDARYVYSPNHAWNLVKLDEEWYHVDVTWEDPIHNNSYGFGNLRNEYINLEDCQIRGIRSHNRWSPDTIKATGTAYGPKTVKKYMEDGVVDTSVGESYQEQMDRFYERVENADGSNMILYTNPQETAEKIISYLEQRLEEKEQKFAFVVRYPDSFQPGRTGDYSRLAKQKNEVERLVNEEINGAYEEVLEKPVRIFLYPKVDAENRYYTYEDGIFYYRAGLRAQVASASNARKAK